VLLARTFEPVPNEVLGIGGILRSSDFGDGAYSIALYVERLVCTNGMVAENLLRKIHLGARLEDDFEFSSDTQELDTKALVSATRDVVRALFEPASIEQKLQAVRDAATNQVNIKTALEGLKARALLTKGETERCAEIYNEPDVELLPPVRTVDGSRPKRGFGTPWRLANAISALGHESDQRRALELQDLAGQVVGIQGRLAA